MIAGSVPRLSALLTSSTALKGGDSLGRPRVFLLHRRLPRPEDSVEVLHRLHRQTPPARRPECCLPRSRPGRGRRRSRTSRSRTFSGIFSAGCRRPSTASRRGTSGRPRSGSRPYQSALYSSMRAELPPRRVGDGAGERAVLDHVADGQVLDHERLVFTNESSGQLVQVVAAPVGDPGVDPGDLRRALARLSEPFCLRASSRWARASARGRGARAAGW